MSDRYCIGIDEAISGNATTVLMRQDDSGKVTVLGEATTPQELHALIAEYEIEVAEVVADLPRSRHPSKPTAEMLAEVERLNPPIREAIPPRLGRKSLTAVAMAEALAPGLINSLMPRPRPPQQPDPKRQAAAAKKRARKAAKRQRDHDQQRAGEEGA